MAEQLYVCVYKMRNLLTITLKRPTYDRNDRESAIAILTYNVLERDGDNFMPKYWAIGAGESEVYIKNIYLVEIESLECQLPFYSMKIGGTYRCVLDCHPECSDLGCQRPNDNTACMFRFRKIKKVNPVFCYRRLKFLNQVRLVEIQNISKDFQTGQIYLNA